MWMCVCVWHMCVCSTNEREWGSIEKANQERVKSSACKSNITSAKKRITFILGARWLIVHNSAICLTPRSCFNPVLCPGWWGGPAEALSRAVKLTETCREQSSNTRDVETFQREPAKKHVQPVRAWQTHTWIFYVIVQEFTFDSQITEISLFWQWKSNPAAGAKQRVPMHLAFCSYFILGLQADVSLLTESTWYNI